MYGHEKGGEVTGNLDFLLRPRRRRLTYHYMFTVYTASTETILRHAERLQATRDYLPIEVKDIIEMNRKKIGQHKSFKFP